MLANEAQEADRLIRNRRKRAFAAVFDLSGPNAPNVERVLAWLRDVCCAQVAAVGATVEETYRLQGRRDVWLMLQAVMNFDEQRVRKMMEVHDDYFDGE